MSTAPRPPLQMSAFSLGPVEKLEGTLSKNAQNMIYARNGTGKSFLTRALRYLDLQAQQLDISDAAFNLVSEESASGVGSFQLSQGPIVIGSLKLNQMTKQVSANTPDRIFHVFSDDFVHSELRQREYAMDGNIETEIRLDQTNIDTKEAEGFLDHKKNEIGKAQMLLQGALETQKVTELASKAAVSKQLKDYKEIGLEKILSRMQQPPLPDRAFKDVLADLDLLKSIPAEPNYPKVINVTQGDKVRFNEIDASLRKITSPSTISEEIKKGIAAHPEFFEAGLEELKKKSDKNCPFCDQSIAHPPASERIELYLAYFADAEGRHKTQLRAAWKDIKSYRSGIDACVTEVATEILKFEILRKYVPSQRHVLLPELTSMVSLLTELLDGYQAAIEAKGVSPSIAVSVPEADFVAELAKLNEIIESINTHFRNIGDAVRKSDDERKAMQREACQAFVEEFTHASWASISVVHELKKDVESAEATLRELKKSDVATSVKTRVAQSFELLMGSFFGKKYTFDRDEFILKRENRAMARGAHRTLSDGEKTAIAFCYFLACAHKKVKATSDYARLYFVFDDPITSMSYDFIFTIAQTLKNMSINAAGEISINPADIAKAQRPDLLVFTHSSYFYNICVTNNVVKDDSAFFLHKVEGEHKLSKRKTYTAPFEMYLKQIVDVHGGQEPDHTTGNAVRCVLEAIGRFCHPDKCDSLSNFIIFLAGDGGFEIKSVLINNLSHGTYYEETPSPEELREACGEAISIVEKYARGQLEMIRVLASGLASQATYVAA